MSKKLRYLLGLILIILIGTYLNWKYCCNCKKEGVENTTTNTSIKESETESKTTTESKSETKTSTQTTNSSTTYNAFSLKDPNGDLALSTNSNFNFNESGLNFITPLSPELDTEIDKLKGYLASNKDKTLSIVGYYKADETNNSAFPNLGLARANSIKNYLTSKGFSSKLIDISGKLNDTMVPDASKVFYGPVSFDVIKSHDDTALLAKLKEDIVKNPLILYFKSGQASINLTAEQRQKIANIAKYLDKVDGAKTIVTGHTDSTGDPAKNIVLGQNRADFAKQYLVKNGIPQQKIITDSKGPNQPIADNSTPEGRAKNRRTVVTLN